MKKSILLTFTAMTCVFSAFSQDGRFSSSRTTPVLKAASQPVIKVIETKSNNKGIRTRNSLYLSAKERLPEHLNSPYTETKPILTADGKTMYFCRQGASKNINGKKDGGDIYVSHFINGNWTSPENLGKPLNNKYVNGACSVSPDGTTLYTLDTYVKNDEWLVGLAKSEQINGKWTYPTSMPIEDHYNHNDYVDYFVSSSGKILLLAIEREDSNGDQDLYVSLRKADDTWSLPINLGARINSYGAEFSPYLSADEKTLFFASNGHPGYGSSDIFVSTRLDESWQNWSTVQNLGQEVNTEDWEGYFFKCAESPEAFFVSDHANPNRSKDLYKINLYNEENAFGVVQLKGQIKDAFNKLPIQAELSLWPINRQNELLLETKTNPEDGSYELAIEMGETYEFEATSKGYMIASGKLTFNTMSYDDPISQDIFLTPLQNGQIIRNDQKITSPYHHVLLNDQMYKQLEELAVLMQKNPNLSVELQNLPFSTGLKGVQNNEKILQAVKGYLLHEGIKEERIFLKPYENTQLAEESYTSPDNNKVNFRIIEN